jgi:hypothetical protein
LAGRFENVDNYFRDGAAQAGRGTRQDSRGVAAKIEQVQSEGEKPMRLTTRVLSLLTLLLLCQPAQAAPKPTSAAPLAGTTTVTWTGTAGIRLSVGKTVEFPAEKIKLYPDAKATYVAAVFVPDKMPAGACAPGQRVCVATEVIWFRDLAETGGNIMRPPPYEAATDHITAAPTPHRVYKGRWDAYLFSDGTVTMEINATGLPGKAAYRATGKPAGGMSRVPATCPVPACSAQKGVADKYAYGAKGVDVGPHGWVQSIAYVQQTSVSTAGVLGQVQPMFARACVYPNLGAPTASPDPAQHPTGCDMTPGNPTAPYLWQGDMYDEFAAGVVAVGRVRIAANADATGQSAAGFRLAALDPYPPAAGGTTTRFGSFVLAFPYGIK